MRSRQGDYFSFSRRGKLSIQRSARSFKKSISRDEENGECACVLEEIGEHIIVFLSPVCSLPSPPWPASGVHVPDSLTPRATTTARPGRVQCHASPPSVRSACLGCLLSIPSVRPSVPSLFVFSLFHPWRLRSPLASAATSALILSPMVAAATEKWLSSFALCWVAPLANAQLISMSSTRATDPTLFFDIFTAGELHMTNKMIVQTTNLASIGFVLNYNYIENQSLSTNGRESWFTAGSLCTPLFPTSLAQQQRRASHRKRGRVAEGREELLKRVTKAHTSTTLVNNNVKTLQIPNLGTAGYVVPWNEDGKEQHSWRI